MIHPLDRHGGEKIILATITEVKGITQKIAADKVVTDGLVKNVDHKAFKQPLPEYEKGESSKVAAKKNHDTKISYAYTNTDNVIGMFKPVEYICMASSNNDNWPNYDVEDE